jgi:hypothetical protein
MKTFGLGTALLGLTLDKLLDQEEQPVLLAQLVLLVLLAQHQLLWVLLDQLELREQLAQ